MPLCPSCAQEFREGALACPGCKTPTLRGRKRWLLIGTALVLAPALVYLLWIGILGADFLEKKAQRFSFDERLLYMECCLAGAIVELAALWFLNRVLRRPFHLFLTLGAAILALVSIPLAISFFVEIFVIGLRGWH
ncbi:MAG: hypothetical protein WB780_22210 [Candidatus Acidiferrales bacterium]